MRKCLGLELYQWNLKNKFMEKKWNKTYNQNGFNLENARKMELNAEDLMILRWFLDFYPLMEKVCNDNKEYGWVHYGYLLHNLQIIYCKEESVAKRFNRYCELGLIEKIVKNTTKGRKAYFRAVANITLLYTSHTDKNLDAHNDKNLDNSFTIYPSTINLNKDTASGLSQNENPTVKDSLQVQKSKKEDSFEQFKQFWILYEKPKKEIDWQKPNIARKKAYSLFQKRLKEMSFDELIENTINYFKFKEIEKSETAPMDILPFLNGKCQVDYKSKVDAICKSTGKLAPLPQKTTMEAEKEVIDTNALTELRNAKYNALTQERQKASDEVRDFLLQYFGEIHHEWINSSIWYQQTLVNGEVDLHIGIFLEGKRKVIEKNAEKIRDRFPLLKGNTIKQIIIKVIK